MAKITISKEMAAEYPSLAEHVGKTVDAQIWREAKANKPLSKIASAPKTKTRKPRKPRAAKTSESK